MKILISAAETSSDAHGAKLLQSIQEIMNSSESIDFYGIGGPKLVDAGLKAVVDSKDLLAMGFGEVLIRLPKIIRSFIRINRWIQTEKPDLAILIDYPDFHFKLAKKLKKMGVPVIYFIPPKVWVWRKSRLRTIKKLFEHVLCIFPFEEEVYEKKSIPVTYVGNPLLDELPLELALQENAKEEMRGHLGIDPKETVFTLMPGSRPAELKRHLEVMLDTAQQTALALRSSEKIKADELVRVLVPLPATIQFEEQEKLIKKWCSLKRNLSIRVEVSMENAHAALIASDVALVKSGTSTLEAGLLGCPHVIVYQTSRLTKFIVKTFVRYKKAIGLSNLVIHRDAKPPYVFREFLFDDVNPPVLVRELLSLLLDEKRKSEIKEAVEVLRSQVIQSDHSPSLVAAQESLKAYYRFVTREPAPPSKWSVFLKKVKSFTKSSVIQLGSFAWSLTNGFIRFLVKRKLLKPLRLPSRVISVGNIQIGGAGKTPLVAKISNEAIARKLNVAILTRGYRGDWEELGGVITPHAKEVDVTLAGDEAVLLHELCPQAWIGVGSDRIAQYQKIIELSDQPIDLVILDDGFQNWKIEKDLEVVALTSSSRSEILYRDFMGSLKNSDLLVWTKGVKNKKSIQRPFVQVRYELEKSLSPKRIWLVSSVADSQAVRVTFDEAGYQVCEHKIFEDHHPFSKAEVEKILLSSKADECIVGMTGKDWVKWKGLLKTEVYELSGHFPYSIECQMNGQINQKILICEPQLVFQEGLSLWEQTLWGK